MAKKPNKSTITYLIISLISILILALTVFLLKDKIFNSSDTKPPITEDNLSQEDSDTKIIEKNRFEGLTLINDNRGVPVLYYHSVDPSEANEVTISPERLKSELQFIKDQGYTTLTMSELNDYLLDNKEIPEKSIVITFDDGYMDNYTNAFPILKELDMKATIFVIATGINDGYYLSSEQLKEMSDYGIDIMSHTFSHPYLTKPGGPSMTYEEQLEEFKSSKRILEDITGKDVTAIAYPFGYFNEDSKRAVKEAGYSLAFTTDIGYSDREDDPLVLDRIYISSHYSIDTINNLLTNTKK